MKVFFLLASLFACAAASDFSISVPTFDATVQAGQNMDVQILVGPDAVSHVNAACYGYLVTDLFSFPKKSASYLASSLVVEHLPVPPSMTWGKFFTSGNSSLRVPWALTCSKISAFMFQIPCPARLSLKYVESLCALKQ